jgi:hypothetical protein
VGTQLNDHVWSLHYDEHNSQRRHCSDPKEPGAQVPRSGMHVVQLTRPFQVSVDSFRNTTEGLHSATTPYTASDEAAELHLAPCSRGATPSSVKEVSFNIAI